MAQNYVFMTDSDSDLLYSIADERNIPVVQMPYALEGKEYLDDNGRSGGEKAFFDKMRTGAAPVTSLLPTEVYLEYFEPILREKDLLFVAFSSKMSNTILNIFEAREQLLKKYPQRKFTVVDTLSISGPQTLLILGAHDLYLQGKSFFCGRFLFMRIPESSRFAGGKECAFPTGKYRIGKCPAHRLLPSVSFPGGPPGRSAGA